MSPRRVSLTRLSSGMSFKAVERVNDKAVVCLRWNTIEPAAQQQILNTASMRFVFKHVPVAQRRGRRRRDFAVLCEPVDTVVDALIHLRGATEPHLETTTWRASGSACQVFREVSN